MASPNDSSTIEMVERSSKRLKTGCNENHREESAKKKTNASNDEEEDVFEDLFAAWTSGASSPEVKIHAFQSLMHHCGTELEWLIAAGITATQLCASLESQVGQLQQHVQAKDEQLKALNNIKADQSKTIQNLIQSQSNHQAKILEQANAITLCSELRAELHHVTSDRDQGTSAFAESQRTVELLQTELRDLKTKLHRMSHDKMKLERDYQSTQRLYMNSSNNKHDTVDTDYYKRKVSDLNGRVQTLQIALNEKDRQLQELRSKEFSGRSGKRSLGNTV